jgi:hypothetical protein
MRTRLKVLGGIFVFILMALPAWSQQTPSIDDMPASMGVVRGIPTDWSHRHLIFSAPDPNTAAGDAVRHDARYWQQVIRRSQNQTDASSAVSARTARLSSVSTARTSRFAKPKPTPSPSSLTGDWSVNLGTSAKVSAGMYPAKFAFEFGGGSASCGTGPTSDFVTYPTTQTVGLKATQTGAFSGKCVNGDTFVINSLTFTCTTGTITLTTQFAPGTNANKSGDNFRDAINANPSSGVTAASSAGNLTLTAITAGSAGNSITLSETSAVFAWAGATLAGGADPASIVGLSNLYSSCSGSGTVPTVNWAYFMGAGSIISTSPVLSRDGSQVAFVESSGGVGKLVLLKWSASSGTLAAPVTLTNTAPGSYRACSAPCMTVIPFNNGDDDLISSPFVDYSGDNLYVGDALGFLHEFTGVFNGSPAETLVNWPVAAGTGPLSSPVFDPVSGSVFVGTGAGTLVRVSGGATPGAPVASGTLAGTIGVKDAPIVDSSAGQVYVFSAHKDVTNGAVFLLPTNFAATTTGTNAIIGTQSTTIPIYSGSFDNIYFTSLTPSNPSGNLYVCGNAGGNATLYEIPITNNAFGSPIVTVDALTNATVACGPVTEFLNGAVDRIFLSVTGNAVTGAPISCAAGSGCIMSFTTTTALIAGAATSGHVTQTGGTSGIIVDNASGGGGSQVYFTPLGDQLCTTSATTGGCGIQASQAALN